MGANFNFNSYPYRYIASFENNEWTETMEELPNKGAQAEANMDAEELSKLLSARNAIGQLPLVNYTTQYGLGCFEGLKVYPQKDGSLAFFRIDANAQRFYNSMKGLRMPPFPKEKFIPVVRELVSKSQALGYCPSYDEEWEKSDFVSATGIYVRPFTYSESGIGVNFCEYPTVIMVAADVGAYFDIKGTPSILVSNKIRASPNGTGWIKTAANYTISTLAKNDAIERGFTECLFLDSRHQKFVEEGSSCNIFFVLNNGNVVTPALGDTVLPGITRDSVITLLSDQNIPIVERDISIEEVFDSAVECFTTGTAVGVSFFGELEYNGKKKIFGDKTTGPVTKQMLTTLKHIQHGLIEDKYNWVLPL